MKLEMKIKFIRLKPKMYSFLVDGSEHIKSKGVNRNVVTTTSQNKYKDVLLNNQCRIQSKDHRIGKHEINKISLSCFDDKIYIHDNGYYRLALGC